MSSTLIFYLAIIVMVAVLAMTYYFVYKKSINDTLAGKTKGKSMPTLKEVGLGLIILGMLMNSINLVNSLNDIRNTIGSLQRRIENLNDRITELEKEKALGTYDFTILSLNGQQAEIEVFARMYDAKENAKITVLFTDSKKEVELIKHQGVYSGSFTTDVFDQLGEMIVQISDGDNQRCEYTKLYFNDIYQKAFPCIVWEDGYNFKAATKDYVSVNGEVIVSLYQGLNKQLKDLSFVYMVDGKDYESMMVKEGELIDGYNYSYDTPYTQIPYQQGQEVSLVARCYDEQGYRYELTIWAQKETLSLVPYPTRIYSPSGELLTIFD